MTKDPTCIGSFTITHIISLAQLLIVIVSAVVALRTLKNSARAARADVKYKLLKEGRDLRIKYNDAKRIGNAAEREHALDDLRGLIIAYYAGAFELAEDIRLGTNTLNALEAELAALFRKQAFAKKWDETHLNFGAGFRLIACKLRQRYTGGQ